MMESCVSPFILLLLFLHSMASLVDVALPMHISTTEWEENPEWARLLHDLAAHHLTRDGCGRAHATALDKAIQERRRHRWRFLERYTLYSELRAIAEERGDAATTLEHLLAVQNTAQIAEEGSLLGGMDRTDVESALLAPPVTNSAEIVLPVLERRLCGRCDCLIALVDPSRIQEGQGFDEAVLCAVEELVEMRRKEEHVRAAYCTEFWLYYERIACVVDLLIRFAQECCLARVGQIEEATGHHLAARLHAITEKLLWMKEDVQSQTYTRDTVQALTRIRTHLCTAEQSASANLARVRHQVKEYESIGLGFDKMAEEHAQLLDAIQNKRWVLSRLGKSDKDGDGDDSKGGEGGGGGGEGGAAGRRGPV